MPRRAESLRYHGRPRASGPWLVVLASGLGALTRSATMPAPHAAAARPPAVVRAVAAGQVAPLDVPRSSSCAGAPYREFDFFAGDWDTYDVDAPGRIVARNHVTPMLGGCALREVYAQRDGLMGESISAYDAGRRVWHQSWVTNRGQLLLLDGRLEGGRMVLEGIDRGSDGAPSTLRGVWWRAGDDVRERAERSRDGGRTWTPVFDIVFRRHR